jgi:hypothetical protein
MESMLDAAWKVTTNCLSEDILASFVDGSLDSDTRSIAEKHLFDCEHCTDALAKKFATAYEQNGDAWWSEYAADQMLHLLALVPGKLDDLVGMFKVTVREPLQLGQTIRLPIFKSGTGDRMRLAASTGDGLSEQRFHQDDPPFEFHLVQFGKQLRIDIRTEKEDSPYANCLGKLEFMEGQTCRHFRAVLIDNGQGQCIFEPQEALAMRPEHQPPTMRFTPLVTLADLESAGTEAYRPILASLLRNAGSQVRRAAVEVAARIYGPNVNSLIGHMTDDDDETVRQAVEKALSQFPQ